MFEKWYGEKCRNQICMFETDCEGHKDMSQPLLIHCKHKENELDCEGNCNSQLCPIRNSELQYSEMKYIKNWEELKDVTSSTHILEIDVDMGNGWILPKNQSDNSFKDKHYLSTHTFYGDFFESSTKLLQSCGFNVVLANWDEIDY